jgi:hypothetical protein
MLNKFQDYLISKGYSELTPKGKPSTANDYSKSRIPKICERENITIDELAQKITVYVDKYDKFGDESEFGNKSNRAFINALKRFKEFVESK